MPLLSQESQRKIREAWENAAVETATEVLRHLPLIVGGTATALLHLLRVKLVPDDQTAVTLILDATLLIAEGLFFLGLALGGLIQLLGELAERLSVSIHRIRETWHTGRRPPDRPTL